MSLLNKKILITYGPTWIPIDDTRVISNISSGLLGKNIAFDALKAKANVTVIEGPVMSPLALKSKALKIYKFHYYDELLNLIKKQLTKKFDVIIQAAAVSDFKVKNPFPRKISSSQKKLNLELVPTKKIINMIKRLNPKAFLVGFKLKSRLSRQSALVKSQKLMKDADCDLVIANSLKNQRYEGFIIDKEQQFLAHEKSRIKLSQSLIRILKERV